MIRRICPEDHELLPIAAGEPADGEVSDHVSGCPACREQVDRLTAEVRSLRRAHAAVPTDADKVNEPKARVADGRGCQQVGRLQVAVR